MDSHKLALEFFLKDASALTGHDLIPVFHKWIQTNAVADHLMIDVADYAHVHEGPGTLLITYEANFAMDNGGGNRGLLYVRKQPIADTTTFAQRLRAIARPILEAAQRLEDDPALTGRIHFRTDTFAFRIYDRLLAPNTAATFAAVKPDLEAFVTELYGKPPVALEFTPSAESLFEVTVKAPSSPTLGQLLSGLPAGVGTT
ncbi:MAG TPA: hypothetical protein VFE47_06355 [Tepidisphaeraceae bacterium]|jgi:hypothetical protein|nr:hypothetical protein [Tepidisphaeraceae bacterium]